MMSSTAVTSSPTRSALRDPVLLIPAVVAAGLAVGWLGVDAGVSGTRVAADLALVMGSRRGLARRARAGALAPIENSARRRRVRTPGRRPSVGELARPLDARLPARGAVGGAPRPGRADVSGGASMVARRAGRDRRRLCGNARRSARRRPRASRLAGRALRRTAADRGRCRRPGAGDPGHCRRSGGARPAREPFARPARSPHSARRRRCWPAPCLTVPAACSGWAG